MASADQTRVRRHLAPVSALVLVTVYLNWRALLGLTSADWDTHDYFFPQFLFFVDALRGGTVPLWNPFIQSGVFFPSLHNVGFFLPFYQMFALLALVVSPLLALEWAVIALQCLGGLGLYGLLAVQHHRRDIALLASVAYLTSVLWLNIGQISILFSFATLPWLLVAAHLIKSQRAGYPAIAFLGISSGMAFACGYPWLSVVNTLVFVGYFAVIDAGGIFRERQSRQQFILFLACCGLTYAALIFPGYSNLLFNYGPFAGDFVSPDDRLRGLNFTNAALKYPSFMVAVAASIDPAIYGNRNLALWTLGVGWSLFSIVILWIVTTSNRQRIEWFWLAIALLGLCYAAAVPPLAGLVSKLPLLNANRFWLLANHFVVLAWIMLAAAWLQSVTGLAPLRLWSAVHRLRDTVFLCVVTTLAVWLYASGASALAYTMLLASLGLAVAAWMLGLQRHLPLVLLAVNVIGFQIALVRFPAIAEKARSPVPALAEKVKTRTARVAVTTANHRDLGRQTYYAYDRPDWSISKVPSSHGYNNLGNPLYWYMKDEPFLERIFDVTDRVRPSRAPARVSLANDNLYAEGLAADVAAMPGTPIASVKQLSAADLPGHHIVEMKLTPNLASATVDVSGRALVLFNNVLAPGWRVTVDGRASEIVPVNYIFMGVEVTTPGRHLVEFRFFPTAAVIAIAGVYLAWLAAGAAAAAGYWRRRRAQPAPLASR